VVTERPIDWTWSDGEDRAVLSGPGLRLAFARVGQRWTHFLELPRGSDGIIIAQATESDPERDGARRVLSPLYQDIQRHEPAKGSGLCLLLTGRSFHHHFSAAVSFRGDPEPTGGFEIDFDVADRCRAPLDSLAATYSVGVYGGALLDADPGRIVWEPLGPDQGRLELIAEAPATLALAEAGRQLTRVQALAKIDLGTFTQRLRYRWRWTSSPDRTR
jgi:hypothetical protein